MHARDLQFDPYPVNEGVYVMPKIVTDSESDSGDGLLDMNEVEGGA